MDFHFGFSIQIPVCAHVLFLPFSCYLLGSTVLEREGEHLLEEKERDSQKLAVQKRHSPFLCHLQFLGAAAFPGVLGHSLHRLGCWGSELVLRPLPEVPDRFSFPWSMSFIQSLHHELPFSEDCETYLLLISQQPSSQSCPSAKGKKGVHRSISGITSMLWHNSISCSGCLRPSQK